MAVHRQSPSNLTELERNPIEELYVWEIQGEKAVTGVAKGIRYRGVFGTISTMVRTEGPRSLYSGLVAGLQRQMAFASIRIGLYDSVKSYYTRGKDSANVGIRILSGCTTGAMAVSVAQPTDVVKVHFQAQMNLQGVGRRYSGTTQAYRQIFQQEGLRGLWKYETSLSFSFVPSFLQLGSWNMVMFVSFEQLKRAMMMSRNRIEVTT
ncbi:mitochondrial uncoupling protein 2-like [Myxocyprinus asiaticus]|uniref:mitochondrial uncoupling protein 2-like n=1 Tax=Myxocyprinus asiaticus TaxID=70543 RepID=UPI0022216403|nr:mitochondrial uncoupling protein 2-like [Myxocyprinus asiaticus]